MTDNPPTKIYFNKIENRIKFKMKNEYYLDFLTPETMKLHGRPQNKITKDKNGKNVLQLKITEAILVYCNIVNNNYQQDSRVLHTFVLNKSFSQFLKTSPTTFIFFKTFSSEFSYIEL